MTLAGVWLASDGSVTFYVDGRGPSYRFRSEVLGTVVSQGFIHRLSEGNYQATGQGVYGAVKMRLCLVQPNVLQCQNLVQVDGGIIDDLLGSFMPNLSAFQPVLTFLRQRQVIRDEDEYDEEDAEVVARREVRKKTVRKKAREKKTRQKKKTLIQESDTDPMEELKKLVGMAAVKKQVEKLDAWAWRQRELKGYQVQSNAPSLHMCFSGGPGTGKTTVARIIGRLLKKYELLNHGKVLEVGRADLVAEFIGQTAPKTEKLVKDALGGVLFIDEAYALSEPGAGGVMQDFGSEALAVLISGMENHRHELCVIVAGYPAEMERFIDANAGLASRISHHIRFYDFTAQELQEVFESMAAAEGLQLDPKILSEFQPYICRAKAASNKRQWGNARTVRNILERGIENQSLRLRKAGKKPGRDQLFRLELVDFTFFSAPDVSIT